METWSILLTAIGLVFVLEGALYALFPAGMKRTVVMLLSLSDNKIREVGLFAAILGVIIVWLVR